MKTGIALFAVLGLIILAGFFDAPDNWEDHEGVNLMSDLPQDEAEASTQYIEDHIPGFVSVETVLEEITEDDGYIVEIYREYEIYTDEHGTIIKREPTEHYDYLRYKMEGEHEHDHGHEHNHD